MIGHEPIIAMRRDRKKPQSVLVWIGKAPFSAAKDWHLHGVAPEVDIMDADNIDGLDLRWSVGLTILINGITNMERIKRAYEAFKRANAGWVVAHLGNDIVDSKGLFNEHH